MPVKLPKTKTLIVTATLLTTACKQPTQPQQSKVLDFGAFTIEAPSDWQKVAIQGIDSYVGKIALDQQDTIGFDLGFYSYPLTEEMPIILTRDASIDSKHLDSANIVIIDDIRQIKDYDQFRKQSLLWDTIDGREVKLVFPRKAGKGFTGIYIDSLWINEHGLQRFNLYGENLKPENQEILLKAIKTIQFHKHFQ